MFQHTLILSTSKVHIPEAINIDFIIHLVNRGLTAIDYFGYEIDNQADYVEEDMKLASAGISYFEFNFDTEESIDYGSLDTEQIYNLLFDIIEKSANIEMRTDEKDIIIYL